MLPSSVPLARIDLTAIVHNLGEVRRLIGATTEVLAMVKADAYGHGATEVAVALSAAGCSSFGVATLAEAAEIVGAVAGSRVVVFGGLLPGEAAAAVRAGVEVATHDGELVDALGAAASASGACVPIHVKIDTGMRRLGIECADAADFVARIASTTGVFAKALWSHLAMAEASDGEATRVQLARLRAAADAVCERRIAGRDGVITRDALGLHLANSAAVIATPETHLDLVRPGLMLYGLYPDAAMRGTVRLRPAMTFDAAVLRIAEVGPGEGIGYGHSYRTSVPARVATLRCGYADGYPRALSNCGAVVVRGHRAPVVGRVCMDHTMVDVTAIDAVVVGDRAVLWGADPAAGEVAAWANTISYELVARVGRRVPRVHSASPDYSSSPG